MAPHILIVDSHPSAAQVTRAGVTRVAPEASLAVEPDPEHGLLSVERWRPDVLIIDPPRHSGPTARLIRELKAGPHVAHVIVLASAPTPGLQREMQRLGVDVYLWKPAPLNAVLDALRAALKRLLEPDTPSAGM